MATVEVRKSMAGKNKSLREDHLRLTTLKQDLTAHLVTLLRRSKQMENLKISLRKDLQKAEDQARVHTNKKIAYIGLLSQQMKDLEDQLQVESIRFRNLESEYQVCLQDYDEVLRVVTAEIEAVKLIESEIANEKQSNASMNAMIFDYEKLKRVLEEERRYFKELSCNQQRSHEERVKELKSILSNLLNQEKQKQGNYKLSCLRLGLCRVHHLYREKIKEYAQRFLRQESKVMGTANLGIKIFKNCLDLASHKHKLSTRKLFTRWHHNIFPKSTLANLVQNAAILDVQTARKISVLNKMMETINERNLTMFHDYEKGKYVLVLGNKVSRKDLHYGFNRWRENYQYKTHAYNKLGKLFFKVVPGYEKRTAFGRWKANANFEARLELANTLLDQYLNTKELARVFRKWRFQLSDDDLGSINTLIDKSKMRQKVLSRVNYEKRKTKALTSLVFKMSKIKLRNYFHKYWANSRGLQVTKLRGQVEKNRAKFTELRKTDKANQNQLAQRNKKYSLLTFRAFMMSAKLKPVMVRWHNTARLLSRRREAILHLALRKENKNKIYVMNDFRKCVQYYEKKEMHQVLTDLNHKMEQINEKSTNYRERLKQCIEELGIVASKKIGDVFSYSIYCQQRVYFNKDLRIKVAALYREIILAQMTRILSGFYLKKSLDEILSRGRERRQELKLDAAYKKFIVGKKKRDAEQAFYGWRGVIRSNKSCFRKMTQSENIVMFHRMASAFVALERKSRAEGIKVKQKKIASTQIVIETKKENLGNLYTQKEKLQASLKKIFCNFIEFEDRNMRMKESDHILRLTKRYFNSYRKNVREQIYGEKILMHFSGFLNQKNNMIFWKGMNAVMFQNLISLTKEELGKINRRKKAFIEKSSKGKLDYEKRLEESVAEHDKHQHYYNYYLNKFEQILSDYASRHDRMEQLYYKREIFQTWKRECFGAKRLAVGANKILQRNLVHPAMQELIRLHKKIESQLKSQDLCADILFKRARNCMKDCLILWRCNLNKVKCDKMKAEADYMIHHREDITEQCKTKAEMISNERVRVRKLRIKIQCFMAMKTDWTEKNYLEVRQIGKIQSKIDKRLVRQTMEGLKWLMFYKKTKRAYLKYTKDKFDRQLKTDVFNSMKIYRQEHYQLVDRMQGITDNIVYQYLRFSLDKIFNVGAHERNKLNYERKRALRHLVMNKVSRVEIIKKKIMAKWQAWLIPRFHYLPTVMKSAELGALKRAFANIREHAYWNPVYIKSAADKITNEGYNDINANTNNLVKEGYDPDEIKDFLGQMNDKDNKSIKSVVNHIRVWPERENLVRAWNSWKQYLTLKKNIKRSLSKVFNIAQGIGRYWNRWKSKDPEFNAILEKESRGNMLGRYQDLGRLLKQYKRDVKDSNVYCQELKEINDQYAEKNDEGIRLALSAMSNSLKCGMKQGIEIWRARVREQHRVETNDRYDELSHGISVLMEKRNKMRYRLASLKDENSQMKGKCTLGAECGQILEKLLKERDTLSINLADKEHNLKLLLEDNLRLKQKIKAAKSNAEKLISKMQKIEGEV